MNQSKLNAAFYLQFILLFVITVLFTRHISVLLLELSIQLFIFLSHKISIRNTAISCFKFFIIYFIIGTICFLISRDLLFSVMLLMKLVMITVIVFPFFVMDGMEAMYGLECILWPLDYLGLSSSRISWNTAKIIRDIKIYLSYFDKYYQEKRSLLLNFRSFKIYDKIELVKEICSTTKRMTTVKVQKLDDTLKLMLFVPEKSRSNYHVTPWKHYDFIVLTIFILLLVSEVIL